MNIEILRIGQRVLRDDRVTTHVALVARAFGASKIYMNEINPDIRDTINQINTTWGGKFEIEFITDWKNVINSKKNTSKIIHLTMYGENINDVQKDIQEEKDVLIVVGAEKVPREVYHKADYNVSIGNQPHSEVAALAIALSKLYNKPYNQKFTGGQVKVLPSSERRNMVANSEI